MYATLLTFFLVQLWETTVDSSTGLLYIYYRIIRYAKYSSEEEYMKNSNNIYDFIIDHLKTFFYPEDWLELDLNFSKTELMTLLVVERQGEVSMSRICDAMNMPMSTATGIVDRMVRKGLLQRERSETDRRMVVVNMTEKGKEIIRHYKGVFGSYIEQIEAALTEEEQQLLYKVFLKIAAILSRREKPDDEQESVPTINKIEIE
ncbi:MAG: hypothetical protein HPY66_1827 [Firmicutes bacterium]|nr:hypothetical protein [Bacillota bacterium]